MNRLYLIFFTFLFLVSCDHKELWREDSSTYNVYINYDWSNITGHDKPTAMRVLFYPLDNEDRTEPYVFDFSGNAGGVAQLPAGHYEVVSYNHDTENILISGTTAESLTATTQKISSNSSTISIPDSLLPENMAIQNSPEWFCRADSADIYVSPDNGNKETRAGDSQRQTITLTPEWAVYKIEYTINGIKGIQYVNKAEATLSGMASSLDIVSNKPSGIQCAVPLETEVSLKDSVLRGSFYVWGTYPSATQKLSLFIWGQDKNVHATKDLTNELKALSHSHSSNYEININITLDVTFSPGGNKGGFNPSVDYYEEINIDIPIK